MAYFIYRVKDNYGRALHGLMVAGDKKEVKTRLRQSEYFFLAAQTASKKSIFNRQVKFQTLIMFTHRLTSLVEAGIPILAATNILWRQTEDETVQLVVSHMKTQLEEGNQISEAMNDFPRIFPKAYRALIQVGEKSGAMVTVLRKLSEYLDYKAQVIARTKKATLYPTVVIIFSVMTVIGMFAFVVPAFQKVLSKLKVELPMLTKLVLAISETIRSPTFIVGFFVLVAAGILVWRFIRTQERLSFYVDHMILRIPYFGRIMYALALGQFVRSLSILLGAGVPIMESLNVATTTVDNMKMASDIRDVKSRIEHGASLYDSFRKSKDFPVMLIEMVGIGETSGMLVQVLEKVTKHFDDEVEYHLNRFLTILEPMLIVVVGLIVLFTLLAIYLPVMSIWQGLMNR